MAAPVYPGDFSAGGPIQAEDFNTRFQDIYRALNATGISGSTGIGDDHVTVGALSPDRIAGTAMTQDGTETISGNKTYNGKSIYENEILGNSTPREFGSLSSGANGGTTTNDSEISVAGVNTVELNYGAATDLNRLLNGTVGQRVVVFNYRGSEITVKNNVGGAVDGKIQMPGTTEIKLKNGTTTGDPPLAVAVEFLAIDDGGVVAWLPLGVIVDPA